MKKVLICDTETYKNYHLFAVYNLETGKSNYVEMFNDSEFGDNTVRKVMRDFTIVTFNGNNYDLPIIAYALSGKTNLQIKQLSDEIIKSNKPAWAICKEKFITIPSYWDSIDIIEVAPGQASLKIYGGRLNAPRMQDLPYHPDEVLTREQANNIRDYCLNDLETTALLYAQLRPQIELRVSMSELYGIDLRSKSDSGIATSVLKSELEKSTGKKYYAPKLPDDYSFQYKDPEFFTFKTEQLKSLYERILKHKFTLRANGSPELPDWLAKTKIDIGGSSYQMGIGGLHSTEKSQYIEVKKGYRLIDADATSFYPSIILGQSLFPNSIGAPFLKVYQSIVDRRIKAKKSGDKTTADTLKITINSSYGLLGNKYSMLYSPDLLLQTTITGQLSLLMLIERMEMKGVSVVSANTDGIVLLYKDEQQNIVNEIAFNWMLDTTFELEYTEYKCIASRDVNSYLTVKPNGSLKRKGVFAEPGLSKNPDRIIIYDAVAEFISKGISLDQTIKSCSDITKFITVRRVTGGATWSDRYLGKAVRFYKSNQIPEDVEINYLKNGNKVPNSSGCRPLMDLPDSFPTDVDYDYYIREAYDLLSEVGYERA